MLLPLHTVTATADRFTDFGHEQTIASQRNQQTRNPQSG
jgi:hypothetical protein